MGMCARSRKMQLKASDVLEDAVRRPARANAAKSDGADVALWSAALQLRIVYLVMRRRKMGHGLAVMGMLLSGVEGCDPSSQD